MVIGVKCLCGAVIPEYSVDNELEFSADGEMYRNITASCDCGNAYSIHIEDVKVNPSIELTNFIDWLYSVGER